VQLGRAAKKSSNFPRYPGIVAAAGGVPVIVDGKIVGAIGVSGSPTGLIDEKAALAGAAVFK